jgi:hypothetical protein
LSCRLVIAARLLRSLGVDFGPPLINLGIIFISVCLLLFGGRSLLQTYPVVDVPMEIDAARVKAARNGSNKT